MRNILLGSLTTVVLLGSAGAIAQDMHSQHHPDQKQNKQMPMQPMMMAPYGYMLVPVTPGMMGGMGMMPMMGMMGGGMGMMGGHGSMGPMGMLKHQIMSDPKLMKLVREHQKKCKQELMKKLSKHPSFIEKLLKVIAMNPDSAREILKKNPELKKKLERVLK